VYFTIAMRLLNMMNCPCTGLPRELSTYILQIVEQALRVHFEVERSGTKSIWHFRENSATQNRTNPFTISPSHRKYLKRKLQRKTSSTHV